MLETIMKKLPENPTLCHTYDKQAISIYSCFIMVIIFFYTVIMDDFDKLQEELPGCRRY